MFICRLKQKWLGCFLAHQLRPERLEQILPVVNAQFVVYRLDIIRDGMIAEMQVFGDLMLSVPLGKQRTNILKSGREGQVLHLPYDA